MRLLVLLALFAPGCALAIPENHFACSVDSQCPPGWFCNGDRCGSQRASTDASIDTGVRVDGGPDAGTDAAHVDAWSAVDAWSDIDSAVDAGMDAGSDTGLDASAPPIDVGTDAPAPVDMGHDAFRWPVAGNFSNAPPSAYSCADGVYDFNVDGWVFADDGGSFTAMCSNTDITCTLHGASALTTGAFDASCMENTSGCPVTFRLVGSFTSNHAWSGTFSASFTSTCSGISPCTTHSFTVSGVRR